MGKMVYKPCCDLVVRRIFFGEATETESTWFIQMAYSKTTVLCQATPLTCHFTQLQFETSTTSFFFEGNLFLFFLKEIYFYFFCRKFILLPQTISSLSPRDDLCGPCIIKYAFVQEPRRSYFIARGRFDCANDP